MPTNGLFTAGPENYARNYDTGAHLRVSPATLHHAAGTTPGVAIFSRQRVVMVIAAEHAYELANGIADALEHGRGAE
ncbi:hypothetical protein QF015_002176 [Paenarthrobacter sp. TE4293]|uniref:hypothetical protein n=1 Tax=Paenarthrobacter sp. TE4293 TaxID=3381695 RepID=UPI003D1A9D66